MKKLFIVAVLILVMFSCEKPSFMDLPKEDVALAVADSTPVMATKAATVMTEYEVSPKFGKPNSTYYAFKVYDISGTLTLAVKLYDKSSGTTTYLPMTKVGSYWTLSTRIASNGWYDYRYVYNGTKAAISTIAAYQLCNTRNVFSAAGTSSISWPFGADGSSWNYRTISSQTWRGGEETKGTAYHYGFGWNEVTHTEIDEQYSDDWNRGTGTQDFNAVIRTPLDGYIDEFGTYSTSLGSSKFVAIIQRGSDDNLYRFYVGHLNSYPSTLYRGKYVRAGIDAIGNLGSTGASSPHAHTNMRIVTNGTRTSVKFYFNAL